MGKGQGERLFEKFFMIQFEATSSIARQRGLVPMSDTQASCAISISK